jgi:hypothetical protein
MGSELLAVELTSCQRLVRRGQHSALLSQPANRAATMKP